MRNTVKFGALLIVGLLLQACESGSSGKSGGSGGGGLDTSDTSAPSVNLTASAAEAYEGELLLLESSASDSRDPAPVLTVTCDAGTLESNALTLPEVDTALPLTCTATAEDAAGNRSYESLQITVLPTEITLAQSTPDAAAGKGLILDYTGPAPSESDELSLLFGGFEAKVLMQGDQLQVMVPSQVQGSSDVELLRNGISTATVIEVEAAPVIEWPRQYSENSIETLAEILQPLKLAGDESVYQSVIDAQAGLAQLSDADSAELAIYIKQNIEPLFGLVEVIPSELAAGFKVNSKLEFDEEKCDRAMLKFVASAIAMGGGAIGVHVGFPAIATPVGAVEFALALGVTVGAAKIARTEMDNIMDVCVGTVAASLIEALQKPDYYYSKDAQRWAQNIAKASASQFENGEAETLELQLHTQIKDDGIRSRFFNELDGIRSVLQELNDLLSNVDQFAGALDGFIAGLPSTDEGSEPAVAAEFELTAISNSNVSGQIESTDGNRLTLSFSFINLAMVREDGTDSFSYTLRHAEDEIEVQVDAQLHADIAPELALSEGGDAIEAGSVFELPRPDEQGRSTAVVLLENLGLGAITIDNVTTSPSGIITVERTVDEDPVVLEGAESGNDASRLYAIDFIGDTTEEEVLVTLGENARPEHNFSFIVRIAERPFPLQMTVRADLTTTQASHPPVYEIGNSTISCGGQIQLGDEESYSMNWEIDVDAASVFVNYPGIGDTANGGYDDFSYTLEINEYEPEVLSGSGCAAYDEETQQCTSPVRFYSESTWAWTVSYDETRSEQAGVPVFSGIVDETQITSWNLDSYTANCYFTHEIIATMQ